MMIQNTDNKLNFFNIFFLTVGLIFISKFFQGAPYIDRQFFVLHAGFIVAMMLFLIFFIITKASSPYKMEFVEIYFLILIIAIPIYSIIRSSYYYDQPISYAALSERGWFAYGLVFLIYNGMKSYKIKQAELLKSFNFLGFFTILYALILYLFIFINPNIIEDTFTITNTESRGLRIGFIKIFFTYLFFYSLISFFKKITLQNMANLFLILVIFAFFIKGRTYFIYLSIGAFYILFNSVKANIRQQLFLVVLLSFFILFLVYQLRDTLFITSVMIGYEQLTNTDLRLDSSIRSRFIATQIVIDQITRDFNLLMFGAGNLSMQYEGGLLNFFGTHFFISDLGVLGGIYKYGLIGFIFLGIIPMFYFIKLFFYSRKHRASNFQFALETLLFFNIISFFQSGLYSEPHIILLCYFILRGVLFQNKVVLK